MSHTQKRPVAQGRPKHRWGAGRNGTAATRGRDCRAVTCIFDEETFQVIRGRALRERTSFCEQVRLLVEWGLDA